MMMPQLPPEYRGHVLAQLTESDRAALTMDQRYALGLPPVDLTPAQRFIESTPGLKRITTLRHAFGLDRQHYVEPQFQLDTDVSSQMSWYYQQLKFLDDRREMIRLVEEMDNYELVTGVLDLYSEDATQPDYDDGEGHVVWIECENAKLRKELMDMLAAVGADEHSPGIARNMCKYGDDFEQLLRDQEKGVVALEYVHPGRVTRVQDRFGKLAGFAAGILTEEELKDEQLLAQIRPEMAKPWDFVHFRLLGSERRTYHGTPIIRGVRRSWRQLSMLSDSMVHYRINRAPDRRVWYIDVGNQPPEEQYRTAQKWRRSWKKRIFTDPATNTFRQEYSPLDVDADIFFPLPTGSNSKVENLTGSGVVGDILDVEFHRDMFFAGVKVPKAFMGFEGDVNAKATLTTQDIRFARGVKRIQRAMVEGWTQVCRVHLAYKGYTADDLLKKENVFHVRMAPVSFLDDLQRSELYTMRVDLVEKLATMGKELGLERSKWIPYLLKKFLCMTDEQAKVFLPDPEEAGNSPGVGSMSGDDKDKEGGEGAKPGDKPSEPNQRVGGKDASLITDTAKIPAVHRLLSELRPLVELTAHPDVKVTDPIPTKDQAAEAVGKTYDHRSSAGKTDKTLLENRIKPFLDDVRTRKAPAKTKK